MRKTFIVIFLVAKLLLVSVVLHAQVKDIDQTTLKKKIHRLEIISEAYLKTWKHLGNGQTEIENLREEAQKALISNAGVVMFKGLANTIQKFFDTPSPDGLLQDLLSEALVDTNSRPKERTQFLAWNKRVLLRQKNLRKSYNLLERILKEPLNRFDDDKAPFPYTKKIWKEGDGQPDPELERITRRLNVIVTVSDHLIELIKKERNGLVEDRRSVESELKSLKAMVEEPKETGELVKNGRFTEGLENWNVGGSGYSGRPQAMKTRGPTVGGGVTLGAYGGTRNVTQIVKVPHLDLEFKARLKIRQWSTFDGGSLGGWVSTGVTFRDKNGKNIATSQYYLNPYAPNQSKPGAHWIQLTPANPIPTPWFDVRCDVAKEAKFHNIDPTAVAEIMVFAIVFGTHEDGVMTIATFDNFSLRRAKNTNKDKKQEF